MLKARHFHDFADFRDHVLATYLAYYPTLASWLGLHQYDSVVEDFSPARREEYLATLHEAKEVLLSKHFADKPDKTTHFECRALEWKINDEIFRMTELKDYEWNPMVYNEQLEIMHLIDRDFAPAAERMRAVLARLRSYPRVLAIARQNLRRNMDRTIVETGLMALEGRLSYLDQVPELIFGEINNPELIEDLTHAIQTAKLAITSFAEAVRTVVLPHAMYDSFRLGPDLMARFVKSSELVTESLDSLLDKGRREMDRLTVELYKASAELDATANPREVFHTFVETEHFNEQTLLKEVEQMLERIRTFVIAHNIVAMPSEVRCKVEETPAHMRWAFAAMNSPGAFERVSTEAFYYVTLPEAEWDAEKRKEFLHTLNRSVLEVISIHEAYPGHYTHFLHLQNIQSKVGKVFQSYGFIEGWAHYTEEMMLNAGWGQGDPRIRMAYLHEALVRISRFVMAIELHRGTMTLSEGQHLFEEKALMRPMAARREAERAVFDPGYLFYTLGKFQIRELRERMEKLPGFSLFDFHNELLSYGSVPIKIIAEMMGG
ncbi:MAG: DUF885 domain-containing protein [Bacteroidota bacterium]|nr:DUF885 domain-containing protein [Bacteroidota bacterium]